MGIKKTLLKSLNRLRSTKHGLVFGFILLTLLSLSVSVNQVNAIGNCTGNESQGVAGTSQPDVNSCYAPGSTTPSANKPSGVTNPGQGTQPVAAAGANTTGTTCAVEKVGWIVCPIVEQSAKAADKLFKFLANNFLQVEPELLTANPTCNGQNKCGTIGVWEQARNLANIMFVIAFIFVIYSQITGAGLNNYGIKRMLPRLIVAAIAVNISYYICQAMVDLSNLLGFNIMRALVDSAHASGPVVFENTQGTNTQTSDGILGSIATGALVAAGIIWLIIAVMSGTIFIVLMICLVIVIILLLRKAFIILLVVISPFAFVAYLLPNTEKLFSKWLNMFWQLLMVFPIVALLLGGGQLASAIILNAATAGNNPEVTYDPKCDPNGKSNDGGYQTPCEGTVPVTVVKPDGSTEKKNAGWTMGLVAAGISVAPLLAVWAVLKGALSAAGAIGGKIAGAVQKGGAGIGGSGAKGMVGARKRAQEGYKNSTVGKMRAREKKIREGQIRAGSYDGMRPLARARSRTNRAYNELGRNAPEGSMRAGYHAQRGRLSDKAMAEQSREMAEDFTANGSYDREYQNGLNEFQQGEAGNNQNQREQGLIRMNAARVAATRLHDDNAARGMMGNIAQAQRAVTRGRMSDDGRQRAEAADATNAAVATGQEQFNAAQQATAQRDSDHGIALGMNQQHDERRRETRISEARAQATHENTMQGLERPGTGPIDNVDVAHELAQREDRRRDAGVPPPGGTPPPNP